MEWEWEWEWLPAADGSGAAFEDKEVVQAELERLVCLEPESGCGEDVRGHLDLVAMVFLEGHAMDESEADEAIEDGIDGRGRNGDDKAAAGAEEAGATGLELLIGGGWEMLEDGEHDDHIEGAGPWRQVLGEVATDHGEALVVAMGCGEGGVNAHGAGPAPAEAGKEHAIGGTEIQYPIACLDVWGSLPDAPVLEESVEEGHGLDGGS